MRGECLEFRIKYIEKRLTVSPCSKFGVSELLEHPEGEHPRGRLAEGVHLISRLLAGEDFPRQSRKNALNNSSYIFCGKYGTWSLH